MTAGPYETEAEARENLAVQQIHAAFRADPGMGRMAPLINAMLVDACVMAGVELGSLRPPGYCPGCRRGSPRPQCRSAASSPVRTSPGGLGPVPEPRRCHHLKQPQPR